jgi:hypothetical protein
MKQDSCPIVGEVAKPAGVGLDELDRAIESLGTGVADAVPTVVAQMGSGTILILILDTYQATVKHCDQDLYNLHTLAVSETLIRQQPNPTRAQIAAADSDELPAKRSRGDQVCDATEFPLIFDPQVLRPGFGEGLCWMPVRLVYTTLIVV